MGLLDCQVLRGNLARMAFLVNQVVVGRQGLLVKKVIRDRQDHEAYLARTERLEIRERMVPRVTQDCLERTASPVLRALMELKVRRDRLVPRVRQVHQVQQDRQVKMVMRANAAHVGHLAPQAPQGRKALPGWTAHQARLEHLGNQDCRVSQVSVASQVLKVR